MSKTTSASKRKYNKMAYHRYEFSVGIDTELDYLLEEYKRVPGNSLSRLLKELLCEHFGIEPYEIHVLYHFERNIHNNNE